MSTSTKWHRRALLSAGSAAVLLLGPVQAAGSSTTEDPPTLEADLSPRVVEPSGQLTYSSIDPCPNVEEGVRVSVAYGEDGWFTSGQEDALSIYDDYADPENDGSWTAVIPAPAGEGRYEIVARCLTDDQDPNDPLPGEPPVIHAEYGALDFDVVSTTPTTEPTPTTTATGPSAEPAHPVPTQPDYTG